MKILLFVLFFCQVSFAANIKDVYEEFYYSSQISSRHCGRNIKKFISLLKKKQIDTSDIEVLKITADGSSWGFGRVIGVNSRWGSQLDNYSIDKWGFHVVALKDGQVYDFSFDTHPRILEFDDYVEEMFLVNDPILLHGSSFRIRGEGPYYTPEISREEFETYQFKIVD